MNDRPGLTPLSAEMLAALSSDGVRHGFFTRSGGVSRGLYRGLNVGIGSDDDPKAVGENRARVAAHLGVAPARLATPYQVHSPDIVVVREPIAGERPKADGIVTDRPGIAIGVVTADCGPVLFADGTAGVVAAAHAGWKGALDGVLENTVAAMETLGARRDRIVAVLGPSISQANYEVGPEFVARFLAAAPENERYFRPSGREGHALFDLRRFTVDRLIEAGIDAAATGHCTYEDEENFYSYRRKTHRGEPDYGRQISAIVLENT